MALRDDCYAIPPAPGCLEQRLAYDPALRDPAVDLFFLRPDGGLGRWSYGPHESPPSLPEGVEPGSDLADYIAACDAHGQPQGDWTPLFRQLGWGDYRVLYHEQVGEPRVSQPR
jgi:hypothetical protein